MKHNLRRMAGALVAAVPLASVLLLAGYPEAGGAALDEVNKAEAKRLAAVEKVRPAVVAVFAAGGRGGGSGVIIDPEGYALTNFHVVQPTGPTMQCGLADGVLYDAVVVGIDQVGDVALIKLLPKTEGKAFPYVALGDSDKVRVGDWSIAMGNPFLLATDFTPTVTFGLVSGVNRYQYPAGTKLEYTDCIQIDTSINPGNSGGPLFNLDGELIGINGRGSFEKRGRVNSGVGYAISVNQIKHFMGHLRAGLDCDHATLGATVRTAVIDENAGIERVRVDSVLGTSDAYRRGIREGDDLRGFLNRSVSTVNEYKNVLGIVPREWRVPVRFDRWNAEKGQFEVTRTLVRLMGVQKREIKEEPKPGDPKPEDPKPGDPPRQPRQPAPPGASGPAAKFYEARPGFANYYFNRQERKRILDAFRKHSDFSEAKADWTLTGSAELTPADKEDPVQKYDAMTIAISDSGCRLQLGALVKHEMDFGAGNFKAAYLRQPNDPTPSGGMLVALNQWRKFLVQGEAGFILKQNADEGRFIYGGHEPYYPDGTEKSMKMAEVIITQHMFIRTKFYFSMDKEKPELLGLECFPIRETDEEAGDPCEIVFGEWKEVDGKRVPHKLTVRCGDAAFGTFAIKTFAAK